MLIFSFLKIHLVQACSYIVTAFFDVSRLRFEINLIRFYDANYNIHKPIIIIIISPLGYFKSNISHDHLEQKPFKSTNMTNEVTIYGLLKHIIGLCILHT